MMIIRKVRLEDIKTVTRLMRDTIRKVNSKDYTKTQIRVWSSKNTSRRLTKRFGDKSVLRVVAVIDGKIVGVASLKIKDRELSGLYIKHTMHGKGIGSKLLKYIELQARCHEIEYIKLYSTLTAVDFYKHHGYVRVRAMSHLFDTVMVPCVLMKKKI